MVEIASPARYRRARTGDGGVRVGLFDEREVARELVEAETNAETVVSCLE